MYYSASSGYDRLDEKRNAGMLLYPGGMPPMHLLFFSKNVFAETNTQSRSIHACNAARKQTYDLRSRQYFFGCLKHCFVFVVGGKIVWLDSFLGSSLTGLILDMSAAGLNIDCCVSPDRPVTVPLLTHATRDVFVDTAVRTRQPPEFLPRNSRVLYGSFAA